MRILMITPYVTLSGHPEFERNKTGFGYMVMDIAKAIGKLEEVEVLATDTRGNGFEQEGVKFMKRSMSAYLWGLCNCLPFRTLLGLRQNYSMSKGSFVRFVYYWLMTGYLRKLLKEGNYDIVHIHGGGFATELWMRVCKLCCQKYVVTLHGLNSFSDSVRLETAGKQYERDFLKRVTEGEFPITVISTGMKRKIENAYGVDDCNNIAVVCNSFNVNEESANGISCKKIYNIPQKAKILLYVGNISDNKNQRQMVEAFGLMFESLQKNTWVLFCGRPSVDGSFEKYVNEKPYSSHLVLCGVVDKNTLSAYYKEADGVVLLSIAEGFGLSLIEGMHYGVPCAMFKDMDAFEDVYNANAVVAIENRKDESVADGLVQLIQTSWDKQQIKEHSKRYEAETMAIKYKRIYEFF